MINLNAEWASCRHLTPQERGNVARLGIDLTTTVRAPGGGLLAAEVSISHETWEPFPGGRKMLVLACDLAADDDVTPEIVDLLAFDPRHPDRWYLRLNVAHWLAGWEVDRRTAAGSWTIVPPICADGRATFESLDVWRNPMSWLRAGCVASGSTAWLNACRSVLTLNRDAEDDDRVTLKIAKANHTRSGAKINLRWVDGVLMAEERHGGIFGAMARQSIEAAFLACLDAAAAQQRIVTTTKGGTYAPKLFASMPQARGCRVRDLEIAMEELLAAGRVMNGVVGKYANRTPRIGLVRPEMEGKNDE